MNLKHLLLASALAPAFANAQYNALWIPDTLSGTTFNLELKDTLAQMRPGNQTVTSAVNNGKYWGPTLIFQKGDTVHMNVTNHLNDSTTVHWHGMHLPAVMDGGPHQVIPPGTTWQPYFKVKNRASTFWYHPHLHEMTQEQFTKGLGGFIIVRDPIEAALALPRTYGVDDIPLTLTSRRYTTANQFQYTTTAYGDYQLTNYTSTAQITLPKQMVRFRILNAEIERAYNLGMSDNRTFYVIGNDGGLLDAPVAVTRLRLGVGERVEILVDLTNDALGGTVNLMSYNTGQIFGFPGAEPAQSGEFGSLLNNLDFNVLHIVVGPQTATPITSVPSVLDPTVPLTLGNATMTRAVQVNGGQPGTPFRFDAAGYNANTINQTVNMGTTEAWTITNNQIFTHSFHIHDVQFKLVSRSGGSVGAFESGWKDSFYLPLGASATFVCKFEDYSDAIHPFMYHCHFSNHEDEGMMGQFVVVDQSTSVASLDAEPNAFTLFPNPTSERLYIDLADKSMVVYYITITNLQGRAVLMLPQPQWQNGIDISQLAPGTYLLQMMDKATKKVTVRTFVKS